MHGFIQLRVWFPCVGALAPTLGAVFCWSIYQSTCWGSEHVKWASLTPSQTREALSRQLETRLCFSVSGCGICKWDFCQEWYPSISDYSGMIGTFQERILLWIDTLHSAWWFLMWKTEQTVLLAESFKRHLDRYSCTVVMSFAKFVPDWHNYSSHPILAKATTAPTPY